MAWKLVRLSVQVPLPCQQLLVRCLPLIAGVESVRRFTLGAQTNPRQAGVVKHALAGEIRRSVLDVFDEYLGSLDALRLKEGGISLAKFNYLMAPSKETFQVIAGLVARVSDEKGRGRDLW